MNSFQRTLHSKRSHIFLQLKWINYFTKSVEIAWIIFILNSTQRLFKLLFVSGGQSWQNWKFFNNCGIIRTPISLNTPLKRTRQSSLSEGKIFQRVINLRILFTEFLCGKKPDREQILQRELTIKTSSLVQMWYIFCKSAGRFVYWNYLIIVLQCTLPVRVICVSCRSSK